MKIAAQYMIICLALAGVACKKKASSGRIAEVAASADQPIATAFAVKSAIAIYDAPEARAKAIATLPIGNKIEVFASRVPDTKIPDKAFWYKVKYTALTADAATTRPPVEGFISEREEVLRENFLVFKKRTEFESVQEVAPGKTDNVKEQLAVMATTALNLRKSPALNSAVVRTLTNGEVLNVLEQSATPVEINKRRAHWYLLEDEKGEKGYAFGGFLLEGGRSEMVALKDSGFQFSSGWVVPLAADARVYTGATGLLRVKAASDNYRLPREWVESHGMLQPGAYMKVDGATSRGGTPRYRIMVRTQIEGDYFETDYYYVDKKSVKFVKDYFQVSRNLPHELDAEFAQKLNEALGGNLNLQCTTVSEFATGGETPRKFKAILAGTGPSIVTEDKDSKCNATERHTVFSEMETENVSFFKSPANGELKDLDGDQIPELVSQGGGRGYWTLEIYALQSNKVVQIAHLGNSEGGGGELNYGYASLSDGLEIQPPSTCDSEAPELKEKCAADIDAIKKNATFLKFDKKLPPFPFYGKLQNGKFVQVAKSG